jgi:multidrug efflux system membrane fusion protein
MTRYVVIGGLIAAVCAGGMTALHVVRTSPAPSPSAAQPSALATAVPVVVEKVAVSDVPIVLDGIGSVAAYNTVNVHAQVAGTIERIGFVEGQTVQPGSLIAQLDKRPYQAALQQAEANLVRDEAHLTNAQTNLGRYVPLEKKGFVSEQQETDQASAVAQLVATVANDKAAVFNAQTQLDYTTITSPIEGVTGIRQVDVGNLLQPSSGTAIVTITQIQPISVVFTLPQKDVPQVQAAMTQAAMTQVEGAKGTLTAIAYAEDDRTRLGNGTLLLVDNTISQSSGTVQLKATFPNPDRALWPGAFVNVRLVVGVRKGGLTVPLSALQQGQAGMFVYLVQSDGTVRQSPVMVAQTRDGRALIDSGVTANDTVVTAGQYRLSDGVRIVAVPAGDPQVQDSSEASAGML